MPKGRTLTFKQTAFIGEYLTNGGNATQAAMKAGYSKKNAESIGLQQLRKTLVKQAIDKAKAKLAARVDFDHIQAAKNAQRHMDGAEGQADYRTALAANDQLIKLTGLYAPEKVQHSGAVALAAVELTPEQRKQIAEALLGGY